MSFLIDFTTFSNNQNNIRKIFTYAKTGNTDVNGLWSVPTSVVTPQNGCILGIRITNYNGDGKSAQLISNKTEYVFRMRNWNLEAQANQSITATIYYVKD